VVLPKDSLEYMHLINALNGFLVASQKPNEENKFILNMYTKNFSQ
jgi:hypothetical protein